MRRSAYFFFLFSGFFIGLSSSASFYGSSYVSLPMHDAKSTTELTFRFRTSRSEALLVLVAGKTDYCLIMLQTGIVKVHINLGAGESEVSSPRGLRLDDLQWHDIRVSRQEGNLELTIDRVHTSAVRLPGRFYELNVHFGVFVGGMGSFNEIFLGNQENFRGCLENLFFNSVDILNKAQESVEVDASSAIVHGLTWDCSSEFDAKSDEAISFVHENSFISFPNWISRTGAMITFKVKTISENAILFYNTGPFSNKDFVALEIRKGMPRLLVNQGNGPFEIRSDIRVSDGSWHEIRAQFNPKYLEVTVDGNRKNARPPLTSGSSRHIDLSGLLYFGGIDPTIRKRAMEEHGVNNRDSALSGCISRIELDGRGIGIPEVVETRKIRPGCVWNYPCFEGGGAVCSEGEECRQRDFSDFVCLKRKNKSDKIKGGSKTPSGDPLIVQEGNRAVISVSNLLPSDYSKYKEDVRFRILNFPMRGKIHVWNRQASNENEALFTLEDVQKDKVYYEHDGSEYSKDFATLNVEVGGGRSKKKSEMKIEIRPTNDPPQLEINPDVVIRVPRGSKTPLDPSLFNVVDLDNDDKDILFTMLPSDENTFVQIIEDSELNKSSKRSVRFSLEALRRHSVYLCPSSLNSDSVRRIGFRISDGIDNGNVAYLKVSSFDLIIYAVNNTGLVIPTGTSALITSYNLTFTTNVPEQGLNIRFDVVSEPMYGRLERLRNNGRWISTKRFFSRHLEKEKLRYVHTRGSNPSRDQFSFTTAIGQDLDSSDVESVHVFRIKFISLQVRKIRNLPVKLVNVRETVITDTHLMFQTYPETSADSDLIYSILYPPKYGSLFSNNEELSSGSNFSQVELLSGHLKYKLSNRAYKEINDSFTFDVRHVNVVGSKSEPIIFRMYHIPGDSEVEITLERLEVEEGGKKTITQKYLNIVASDIRHFVFNITKAPRHGQLDILSVNKVDVLRSNATFFTSDEIKDDRIVYKHDDSESRRDTFHFIVMSGSRSRHDFQYLAVFHIHIVLRNDQTPTRVVDKVFQVVEGSQKLLTDKDLLFADHDIDSRPQDIRYTHTAIPNGELVSIDNPTKPIFQFSQKDLKDRKILFKHLGASFGRIMLWVSDGLFFVSTELKVRASPPFIIVLNNTGLVVQEKEVSFITSRNLSIETNLNAFGPSIRFRITASPKYGNLYKDDVPVSVFTEEDISRQRVEYRNTQGTVSKDFFKFIVEAGNTEDGKKVFVNDDEQTFYFQIYPESYWDPLEISSNKSLLVEESTSIAITREDLRVSRRDISPSDIIYLVISPPAYGYLEIDPLAEDERELLDNGRVHTFTQRVINEGRLHYIQSVSNQSDDSFIFDVSNGISSLKELTFHFTIVPANLYIETRELVVTEGNRVALSTDNLHVVTSYYEDKIKDYLIVDPPTRGRLESVDARKDVVTLFSVDDLEKKSIWYIHDGSETNGDHFSLVANIGSKTSKPTTMKVKVLPVNDKTPVIVNNTGLNVWAGASDIPITTEHLSAIDEDSKDENITFEISGLSSGVISLANGDGGRTREIQRFTESDLKNRRVLFRDSGGRSGSMKIFVSDGLNVGKSTAFRFRIQELELQLINRNPINVFPMMASRVTGNHLYVTTSAQTDELRPRPIMFIVRKHPKLGRLLLDDEGDETTKFFHSYDVVSNFTQEDLISERLQYVHEVPFNNLSASDSFSLEATTPFAAKKLNILLNVRISVSSSDGIEQLLGKENLIVKEGARIQVRSRNLNVSGISDFIRTHVKGGSVNGINVRISQLPKYGHLFFHEGKVRSGDAFSQADFDNGYLSYRHDHSDTRRDSIGISIYLLGDRSHIYGDGRGVTADILLYNGYINVTIVPVNDREMTLLTDKPSITVVQGLAKPITRDRLLVVDPDNSPSELLYEILNPPNYGYLFLSNGRNDSSVETFTQEDIDDENVIYKHEGSIEPVDFYFRISDGHHKAIYRHFRIQVVPLEIHLANQSDILIQQGTHTAYIKSKNLGVSTNGLRSRTYYNITRSPKGGKLYMNDEPVDSFGQIHVDNEEVVYIQNDMSLSNDSFVVTIQNEKAVPMKAIVFNIKVVPLLRCEKLFTFDLAQNINDSRPLLRDYLDASQLAGLTNSNPVYFIMRSPLYGKIMRIVKPSGDRRKSLRDKEIWQFTHEDVKNRIIHYVPSEYEMSLAKEFSNDSFVYKLVAPGVQPAIGTFRINIKPLTKPSKTVPNPITEDVSTSVTNEKERSLSRDFLIAATSILAIIVLLVFVIIFIKCRRDRYRLKNTTPHPKAFQTSSSSRSSSRMGSYGGTLQRTLKRNTSYSLNDDEDDGPGLLPVPPGLHHSHHHHIHREPSPRFLHCNGGSGQRGLSVGGLLNPSEEGGDNNHHPQESDSWGESSRGSSPESSIPPGMPAFRVIPLSGTTAAGAAAESESSGTHVSDSTPGFTTLGSTGFGSDVANSKEVFNNFNNLSDAGSESPRNTGWNSEATDPLKGGGPMLRKNQYWV